jgi:type II secretory ATPase GspE/PulE/Tfp pilus assembly ATPase PilB-like protein
MKLTFESSKEEDQAQPKPGGGQAEEKGIVDKVDQVLADALQAQATDIHVEPGLEETRVRVRVQGQLQEAATFPATLHHKLVNRFKILGGMDITRNKIAQRGFFKVKAEGVNAECETFVLPSTLGEKVTVDILLKRGLELSLEHLGFFTEVLKSLKDALSKPHGLVLVVGPPASGRTTTCFASLAALNSPQREVITFEQVNKYELPGVVHCKPSPQHDFGFSQGVRAMMDANPDVCLVGEVQDPDVAKLMLQGAFAKRIVLGRMAAHDSVNALVTLMDMGIQPFLLTAAVNAVLSQRLLRRICDGCKEAYEAPEQLINEIGYKMKPGMQFFRGKGCAACGGSGYRGNIALFELLTPSEEINEALVARRSPQEIRDIAQKAGMVPLKRDGVNKAAMGYTAIEEVLNAL